MARILGIGIATLDIINTVDHFPEEDSEVRAISQSCRRGGNVTNSLVVLSQLGHQTTWAGTIADDVNSQLIRADLEKYSVDMGPVALVSDAHVPTSYVTLNRQNGSRTIVHYRDLDEYHFQTFKNIDLNAYDWLHFEGRNVSETLKMMQYAEKTAPQIPRSVEIEKTREGIRELCSHANLLLYSRSYIQNETGTKKTPVASSINSIASTYLEDMFQQIPVADHVCTWGDRGAYGISRDGTHFHVPAFKPEKIIDTLGAGDTFMAGLIHGRLTGQDLATSTSMACTLAAKKCSQHGFEGLSL